MQAGTRGWVAGLGDPLWSVNALTWIRARAADTGGSLGAFEQRLTAAGNPPRHVHRNEDEAWRILEGTIDFYIGDERIPAGPGSFVFAPRGIPHHFAVTSPEVRMMVIVTPGGFEGFLQEVGERTTGDELPPSAEIDVGRLMEVSARYGLEILGPPQA